MIQYMRFTAKIPLKDFPDMMKMHSVPLPGGHTIYLLPIPMLIVVPMQAPAVKKQSAFPTQKPPL